MKSHLLLRWMTLFACITAVTTTSNAETVTYDDTDHNLRYTIDTDAQTAELCGPISSSTVITDLVIPDYIVYNSTNIPVTKIRDFAFGDDRSTLVNGTLSIGSKVQTIGYAAFRGCAGLVGSLNIPNSVVIIDGSAFNECTGFTGSLIIGESVQTIGSWAFRLTGFTGSLNIPKSVQVIESTAFYRCTGFTGTLVIGENVQTIGAYAFEGCSGFTGILNIPNSVQSIKLGAFMGCTGFTGSLVIGDNVQIIECNAFRNCTGFTGSLTIGDNVQTIGNSAFKGCTGFTGSLTIGEGVQRIEYDSFYGCLGFTGSLVIPNSVQYVGYNAFRGCSGFTGSLTIGNNVQTIGYSAFEDCSGFSGPLVIPNSVQTISSQVFMRCSGFTGSLTIPNSVQSIGGMAFYGCRGLVGSLTIGNSVQTIGYCAFRDCTGFTGSLTLPKSVREIESGAFDIVSFENIICNPTTPPNIVYDNTNKIYDNIFASSQYTKPLYVPTESIDAYKAATEWEKFTNIIPIFVPATAISLNKENLELYVGGDECLIATLQPDNTTDKTITWSSDNESIATVGSDGTVTAVSEGVATVSASCGDISATCSITVIRRPEMPTELLRKGNGTSCTFVAMMPLTDSELASQGYSYVFGYTDSQSTVQVLSNTNLRYCHTNSAIYNNSQNDFWVFAYWINDNGDIVCSQRRHLDGRVDDDFDGDGIVMQAVCPTDGSNVAVYTLYGHYVGDSTESLLPGIYIVRTITNGSVSVEKIVIR